MDVENITYSAGSTVTVQFVGANPRVSILALHLTLGQIMSARLGTTEQSPPRGHIPHCRPAHGWRLDDRTHGLASIYHLSVEQDEYFLGHKHGECKLVSVIFYRVAF